MASLAYLSNHPVDRREQAYQAAIAVCDEAKRLSLSEWFIRESNTDVKIENGRHRSTWCPHCGLSKSGNKRVFITDDCHWECWTCEEKGSILDAEMLRYGGTMSEAARRLLGLAHDDANHGRPVVLRQVINDDAKHAALAAEKKKHDAVCAVVRLICEHTKDVRDEAAVKYLTGTALGERGLPVAVIEEAIARNILRILPSNVTLTNALIRSVVPEQLLRDADLWKEDAKIPWVSYRPIWFIAPGGISSELRIARPARKGEAKSVRIGPKNRPYYWEGTKPTGCAIVEGVPDLLALVALGYEGDILGLPGANTWDIEWFVKMANARGTKRFELLFDNDDQKAKNPGQAAAASLGEEMTKHGIAWKNTILPSGDVNDFWLHKVLNK